MELGPNLYSKWLNCVKKKFKDQIKNLEKIILSIHSDLWTTKMLGESSKKLNFY